MHINGSIQRELDAAREEGRREGLREAIALLDELVACAAAYGVAAKLLREKVGNG